METSLGSCIVGASPINNREKYCHNVQFISIKEDKVDLWKYMEAENAGISKGCPCIVKTDEEIQYERVMVQK